MWKGVEHICEKCTEKHMHEIYMHETCSEKKGLDASARRAIQVSQQTPQADLNFFFKILVDFLDVKGPLNIRLSWMLPLYNIIITYNNPEERAF